MRQKARSVGLVNQGGPPAVSLVVEFELAFQDLFGRAYRLAYRILGSGPAAEDVAAEALTRAFADWERVGHLPYRDAWVLRVAVNLALDQVRRPRIRPGAAEAADPGESVALRVALIQALRALPARQRDTIALKFFADLSQAEVARVLGISTGTAKTHIHRGLAALRTQFAGEIGDKVRAEQEERVRLRTYDDARKAMNESRIVTGRVLGWGDCGLKIDVGGVSAWLRTDQAGFYVGDDYSWMIGHPVEVKVIRVCEDEACIFVSRRAVLDSDRLKALRRAILSGLQPGVPQLGKVTLVLPFGAFVDLGVGVFGVLPASEFASPEEGREQIKARNEPTAMGPVVRGRGVRVEVVSVDLERERALLRLS